MFGDKVVPGPTHPAFRCQSFAEQTLRTLCLAYKEVDEDVYQEWCQRHQEAGILLQNRAHALHQVYEEMEQGLQVCRARRAGAPAPPPRQGAESPLSLPPAPCTPPPSCWESRPLRTDSRTASATRSSVSSRGVSKCGYSQGISKVGPRAATPSAERRGMGGRELLTCLLRHQQPVPRAWARHCPPPCPGRGEMGTIQNAGVSPPPDTSLGWVGTVLSTS